MITFEKLPGEVGRVQLELKRWNQPRIGVIDEVEREDGTIRFNVRVQDEGRDKPFINQWFSRREAAIDFFSGVYVHKEDRNRK